MLDMGMSYLRYYSLMHICSLFLYMEGRGRREPVGGEDGVKFYTLYMEGRCRREPVGGGRQCKILYSIYEGRDRREPVGGEGGAI